MIALAIALAITTCTTIVAAYAAYAARKNAESAAQAAQRWREAAQSRAQRGLGETEVFAAVTDDEEVGWPEAERLVNDDGAR